jgi:hypothetical protein
MAHSKYSSPPQGTNKLTAYFSTSPNKRCTIINVDEENQGNGVSPKRQKVHGVSTFASRQEISDTTMDIVFALTRIKSYKDHAAAVLSVRAWDDDVFIARPGAIIGRSLNVDTKSIGNVVPRRLINKKMNLGIYGSDSGVSRKQLEIKRVTPLLKIKQLATVTNLVYVVRYNPFTKSLESKGAYVRKDTEFELKTGDILVMDNGRATPRHIFRVVKCAVPRQTTVSKKNSLEQLQSQSSLTSSHVIDLIHETSPRKRALEEGQSQTSSAKKIDLVNESASSKRVLDKLQSNVSSISIQMIDLVDETVSAKREFEQERAHPSLPSARIIDSVDEITSSKREPEKMQSILSATSVNQTESRNKVLEQVKSNSSATSDQISGLVFEAGSTRGVLEKVKSYSCVDYFSGRDPRSRQVHSHSSVTAAQMIDSVLCPSQKSEASSPLVVVKEQLEFDASILKNESKLVEPARSDRIVSSHEITQGTRFSKAKVALTEKPVQEVDASISTNTVLGSFLVETCKTSPPRELHSAAGFNRNAQALSAASRTNQLGKVPSSALQRVKRRSTNIKMGTRRTSPHRELRSSAGLAKKVEASNGVVQAAKLEKVAGRARHPLKRISTADFTIGIHNQILKPPEVGDLIRVYYESQDTFSRMRSSWWLGTVQGVTKSRKKGNTGQPMYCLSTIFQDKTYGEHEFPSPDVQKLEIDGTSYFAQVWASGESERRREFAFDLNPDSLLVGDLVDVLYQNGKPDGTWFRGRVAAVDSTTSTCTIVYDDGDAETNVPIGNGKIILVEPGVSNASWLISLHVYDDFAARTRNKICNKHAKVPDKVIGGVTSVEEHNGEIVVVISLINRKKQVRLSYNDFVKYLFESLLSRYHSMNKWPDGVETNDEEPNQSSAIKTSEKERTQPRTKTASKLAEEFREEDWDISTSTEPQAKQPEPTVMKEMSHTVSNSFVRALNSSDPAVGADFFIQLARGYRRGMNPTLGQLVRVLLCDGPTNGGTKFPDPHRVEVTLKYLDALIACEGGNVNLSISCSPDEWLTLHDMLTTIVSPHYLYDGDALSEAAEAWGRCVDSLHLCKSGARFLNMLFKAELGEEIRKKTTDRQKCRTGPIATAILTNASGSRDSLKVIIRIFVGSWIRFGHYVLCDFAPLKAKTGAPSSASIVRCRDEAKRMLHELGSVVSYAIWLYCVCEVVRTSNRDLACLIKEIYDSETISNNFDPAVFMSTKKTPEGYFQKLKVYMITCLDDSVLVGLQVNLAKQLGVEKEFKLVVK